MAKENMFQLARMILHDQCPPDNRMYLCNMGEDPECDCTECWDKYLFWQSMDIEETLMSLIERRNIKEVKIYDLLSL